VREELDQLCGRIESEVAEIKEIRDLAFRRWQKALRDEDYLGSVAFDLHSFYQGVERIFEAIAKSIDRTVHSGDRWHRSLLAQMTEEIPERLLNTHYLDIIKRRDKLAKIDNKSIS